MSQAKLKGIPAVKSVMTAFPHSVDLDAPIGRAQEMMEEHDIRHLPVMSAGKLVSVISDRDISLALEPGLGLPSEMKILVRDLCAPVAYVVDLNEPLDAVLLHMAQAHLGSALVVKEGRLAGIFTVTDACRCYGEFLRQIFPTVTSDDAA